MNVSDERLLLLSQLFLEFITKVAVSFMKFSLTWEEWSSGFEMGSRNDQS